MNFCMIYTAMMSLVGLLVRTLILVEIKPAISGEMAAMQNLGFCCLRKKTSKTQPLVSHCPLNQGAKGAGRNHFQALKLDTFPVEINATPSLKASEQWQATHQRHSSKY